MTGYTAAGGQISGTELDRLAREAWRLMLSQSRNQVRKVEADTPLGCLVKDCFRELMEEGAASGQGTVASETLGQWSRTYRDEGRTRDQRRISILREYLGETGLLYRGWGS